MTTYLVQFIEHPRCDCYSDCYCGAKESETVWDLNQTAETIADRLFRQAAFGAYEPNYNTIIIDGIVVLSIDSAISYFINYISGSTPTVFPYGTAEGLPPPPTVEVKRAMSTEFYWYVENNREAEAKSAYIKFKTILDAARQLYLDEMEARKQRAKDAQRDKRNREAAQRRSKKADDIATMERLMTKYPKEAQKKMHITD